MFIPELAIKSEDDFDFSKFRESKDEKGVLNYLRGFDKVKAIENLALINTQTSQLIKIKDLFE